MCLLLMDIYSFNWTLGLKRENNYTPMPGTGPGNACHNAFLFLAPASSGPPLPIAPDYKYKMYMISFHSYFYLKMCKTRGSPRPGIADLVIHVCLV